MNEGWIPTLLLTAAIALIFYRRVRRLFLRQKLNRTKLAIRLGLIGLLCSMLFPLLSMARGLLPTSAGLAVGLTLGVVAFQWTRFESIDGEIHFTPNGTIGLAVLSLFVGRMAYRLTRMGAGSEMFRSPAGQHPTDFGALQGSPISSAILFVLLGYYLAYTAALWIRGHGMAAGSPATIESIAENDA